MFTESSACLASKRKEECRGNRRKSDTGMVCWTGRIPYRRRGE